MCGRFFFSKSCSYPSFWELKSTSVTSLPSLSIPYPSLSAYTTAWNSLPDILKTLLLSISLSFILNFEISAFLDSANSAINGLDWEMYPIRALLN